MQRRDSNHEFLLLGDFPIVGLAELTHIVPSTFEPIVVTLAEL